MSIKAIFEQRVVLFKQNKKNITKLLKFFNISPSVSFNVINYYDDNIVKIKKTNTTEYHKNIYENILIKLDSNNLNKLLYKYKITYDFEELLIKLLTFILKLILKFKANIRKFNICSSLSYIISRIQNYDNFFVFNNNKENEKINDVIIIMVQKLEKTSKTNIIEKINTKVLHKPVLKKYTNPGFMQEKTLSLTVYNGCKLLLEKEQFYLEYIELLYCYYANICKQLIDIKNIILQSLKKHNH